MGIFGRQAAARLDSLSLADETAASHLSAALEVAAPIVFEPRFEVQCADGSSPITGPWGDIGWLPRGSYDVRITLPPQAEAGKTVEMRMYHRSGMERQLGAVASAVVPNVSPRPSGQGIEIRSRPGTTPIEQLGWKKGHTDWFFRHFDHAATTVISYLLGDHPSLRGSILDVGCGDGITDLGIALRTQCQQFVGIDPFHQFDRLPGIVAENNLPPDIMKACNLRFMAEDANFLPFPDNSFDVIVSWGSVEHMAGGYLQALREMKRVLRPDGLIMAAPGLYYSNIGHHLTEFSTEPFFHLKKSREEIRKMVLETPPKYIDRSGEFSSNEQFYQWFTELNPITVGRFEQEMRALDFRPWRIALRTDGLVEYTPEIEHYPIQDLANTELYSSWINRKKAR